MKAVVLVLACVAVAAALSVKSSPEARFMSTEAGVESTMSAATVVSDRDYAALKHEEAQKAVRALHLPGDKPDLLADLGIHADAETDESELANDEELLALAADTESSSEEDAESAETAEGLEAEIEAAEAEEDAAEVLIETAAVEEDEDEEEDESESEEESEEESEDAVFLEVADEEEAEDEAEDEAEEEAEDEEESEDEDEAEAEDESEDLALIEEEAEKPKAYISPVLRPALPSKHNDEMPDAAYDKTAETNLFPPAKFLVGAGPKPPAYTASEIAAADAKIAKAKALKAKAAAAPKPAVAAVKAAKRSKRSKRSKRVNRRKGRKNRRAARKGKKGGRRSRKNRRAARKGRKNRKNRRGGKRRGGKRSKKSAKKSAKAKAKLSKKCQKNPNDPRCIITAPYLQDIRDSRHKHFIKTTNDLLNEVDDGILEHMVYPKIADPNKKKCKTKKAKKF